MTNETVGVVDDTVAPGLRRTLRGQAGVAVFGPYVTVTHGVYKVDFRLALAAGDLPDDVHCATLEVTSEWGRRKLAIRPVVASELGADLRTIRLLFTLRDIHMLEFRVLVNGTHELVLDPKPVMRRVSAILDEAPRAELGNLADDLDAFADDTRRILRPLSPRALHGIDLVRLGNEGDGGYVCPDDFAGVDTALSFGINDDISWDLDVADRGLTVYQFDHTVADPAPDDPRMLFEPKRIAERSGPDTQSLGDLIRRHDRGDARPNIILKMDIEGGEWPVLEHTSAQDLSRLAWIVCELHYFQGLARGFHRALVDRCLHKLAGDFASVHVHSNVWGGYCSLANMVVPNVVELTFVNRALYELRDSAATFPTRLDRSCDPLQPDFYLGSFRFETSLVGRSSIVATAP